jgi:cyclic-di-GMP phosphodiesterase TipF (flagellum assembly factor)
MRLATLFVAFCMILIAASAGAIGFLYFDLSNSQAATLAAATLAALALYNVVATRLGLRSVVGRQLADLARGHADLSRQMAEMGRRLAAMEGKVESALDQTRAVTDPLTLELGELGTLLKRLAETLAAQQATIDALASDRPANAAAEGSGELRSASMPEAPAAIATSSAPQLDAGAIRKALDENRIDLYLQPIVSLPQRKVRHYEALSRMRTEQGEVLTAEQFISEAETGGLMPRIDLLGANRCVQIARRLLSKNRDIGLFCNVSTATLAEPASRSEFLDLMGANRALAHCLILEFALAAVRRMTAVEHAALSELSERGFRFSVDNVTDLRLEAGDLASRGFRFVKVPAALLLKSSSPALGGIAPDQLSDLLGRFGIDLIADRIELEASVVDLIDSDVRYAQGFLFSPPRAVRAEALQPLSDHAPGGVPAGPTLVADAAPTGIDSTDREELATLDRETATNG